MKKYNKEDLYKIEYKNNFWILGNMFKKVKPLDNIELSLDLWLVNGEDGVVFTVFNGFLSLKWDYINKDKEKHNYYVSKKDIDKLFSLKECETVYWNDMKEYVSWIYDEKVFENIWGRNWIIREKGVIQLWISYWKRQENIMIELNGDTVTFEDNWISFI